MGRRPADELVALVLTFTVCAVLLLVVSDLMLAARVSEADRTESLAALAAIGLALAAGVARWLSHAGAARRRRRRPFEHDDPDEDA